MIYKYSHPEYFADWEKPDFKIYSGRLVLYGAGRRGMVAAHCLQKLGVDFLVYCDSDPEKWGTIVCGHNVISPDELNKKYHDYPILVTTNHWYYLREYLFNQGYSQIFNCVGLFMTIDFDGFESEYSLEYMCRNTDQYYTSLMKPSGDGAGFMPYIQIPVTSRCTLRCKECNSYIPYRDGIGEDFSIEILVDGVEKLSTAYEKIGSVLVYGGEPLLFTELSNYLTYLLSKPNIENVYLVTNGTVVPDEKLLSVMQNDRFICRISDYGSLSKKKEELIRVFERRGILYEITQFGHWDLTPTVENLNETEEELMYKVRNCCTVAKMPTYLNGKLFFCGFSAYYDYYKALPDFGDNNVNILSFNGNAAELRNEINKKLTMAIDGMPKQACRFCKFDHLAQHLPVAEQTNESLKFRKVGQGLHD